MWYLKVPSIFKSENPGTLFGMRPDFNGFGIFIFKSGNGIDWNVMGVFNRGMDNIEFKEMDMSVCKFVNV